MRLPSGGAVENLPAHAAIFCHSNIFGPRFFNKFLLPMPLLFLLLFRRIVVWAGVRVRVLTYVRVFAYVVAVAVCIAAAVA